jgi:hypothetical protein
MPDLAVVGTAVLVAVVVTPVLLVNFESTDSAVSKNF